MFNSGDSFETTFGAWVLALGITVLALLAGGIVRWILKRIGNARGFRVLPELATVLANLVVLVGLRLAIEAAPMSSRFTAWGLDAVYIYGVFVVLGLTRRLALIGIGWTAQRAGAATLQQGFIPLMRNVITLFIFFMGAIMVLKHFNYDVMSLLTALGVGSLAVGLASKETLSNMISGFTLIIDQNLHPGDRIRLNEFTGDVEEIGLRSTRIRIGNGNVLIVPNSELVNTKIVNLSQPTRAIACSVSFKVAPDVDFVKVRETALEAIKQGPHIAKDRAMSVNLISLADGNQQIGVSFWVNDLEHEGAAISALNERLVETLWRQKISLSRPSAPAPQGST
jgi:MscS family membrane protein